MYLGANGDYYVRKRGHSPDAEASPSANGAALNAATQNDAGHFRRGGRGDDERRLDVDAERRLDVDAERSSAGTEEGLGAGLCCPGLRSSCTGTILLKYRPFN